MLAERTGVRRLGFLDLGTTTGPVWAAGDHDTGRRHALGVSDHLLTPGLLAGAQPLTLAEAHFGDPHPDWWSDAAHSDAD
jgi:hypothetical protein